MQPLKTSKINIVFAAGVFVLLAVLVFIPAGIFFVNDADISKTVRGADSQAVLIAQEAVFTGLQKAIELQAGGVLFSHRGRFKGYDFDEVYDFKSGGVTGRYVLRLSTHSPQNLIIESKARTSGGAVAAVARYFRQSSTAGALWGENADLKTCANAHWGPVYASKKIEAGWSVYPRKYSMGDVANRDPNGLDAPNTDTFEWWSYQPLPALPVVDMDYIIKRSKEGGNYFKEANIVLSDTVDSKPQVRYFERNLKLKGKVFINGITVVKGDLELEGAACGATTARLPYKAWREYVLLDTAAQGEYPGDLGYQINSQTYEFGGALSSLSVRGFLFVGGDLIVRKEHNIYGSCVVNGGISGVGKLNIFYDDTLEIPVLSKMLLNYDEQILEASWAY